MLERICLKGYITPQIAVLAQLVERLLAKQKAAGSRPAYRTNPPVPYLQIFFTCHDDIVYIKTINYLIIF